MQTSVASFRVGIAAFIVPFMFFYNSALLMDAPWFEVARALVTATIGVYLLSGGVMGWFGQIAANWMIRLVLIAAALLMIEGGGWTDLVGIVMGMAVLLVQRKRREPEVSIAS